MDILKTFEETKRLLPRKATTMKSPLKHSLNALHIYCRLMDLGMSRKWARKVGACYERITWQFLYGGTGI